MNFYLVLEDGKAPDCVSNIFISPLAPLAKAGLFQE